jgi:NAD(P)-dependent dehydrogenase (short-subunit alcohol dehydrogenase family)
VDVVVTGASSGIGLATVEALLGAGATVFATARSDADLARLAALAPGRVHAIRLDVTDAMSIRDAATRIETLLGGRTLAGLVNNAGVAVPGPLLHVPIDELRRQFEVNVFGQIAVTQALLPLLGARRDMHGKPGRIVNVTSISGRRAMPFVGAYAGSKHAMEGLSEALRRELMLYGIDVVVVAPGAVATPIWDKADQTASDSPYLRTDYAEAMRKLAARMIGVGRAGLPASVVAQTIVEALTVPQPKTRYTLVRNKLVSWDLARLLPKRFVDRKIAATLGLVRKR